jgi:2,5-diamino-6-(ribosylamino)-4(3H)-pyrimidinone 5'-phosphate reductase
MCMYTLNFKSQGQPYFLANFAITIDGKVAGTRSPYWPIASRLDFEVLEDLRAQSDALLHGKNTAMEHQHGKFLSEAEFEAKRQAYGKTKQYAYIVVSAHPDEELMNHLSKAGNVRNILVTTAEAPIEDEKGVEVWRCGSKQVDLHQLKALLKQNEIRTCLVEGGPTVFGSFVDANLINELFLTVSPKLIGSGGTMLSLIEGYEFLPEDVKNLKLMEVNQKGDELYLRYKFAE